MTILIIVFLYSIYFLSYAICWIIPRKKNIWVFGGRNGKLFDDNVKYLFLNIANNHVDDILPIWISKNKNIVENLRKNNYNAYYAYGLKGIYYNLRAKYIITDLCFSSVNFWCCGGATKIKMFHAAPLKKLGYDAGLHKSINRFKYFCIEGNGNGYLVSISDFFVNIYESAFRIKKEKIIVTGYPRNDAMFYPIKGQYITEKDDIDYSIYDKLSELKSQSKLILYIPTFRLEDYELKKDPFAENLDYKKLNEFLDKTNSFFIIKPHPVMPRGFTNNGYNRIIFLPNIIDIYPLLPKIDILITDYSSVYFDFLLMDKPLIFYPYDLKKYITDDRDLYFDYDTFTPGPKSYVFEELLDWINYYIKNSDSDKFADQRKKIKSICLNYNDGKSSERIYDFIHNLK